MNYEFVSLNDAKACPEPVEGDLSILSLRASAQILRGVQHDKGFCKLTAKG
jgi:hypothetical protein